MVMLEEEASCCPEDWLWFSSSVSHLLESSVLQVKEGDIDTRKTKRKDKGWCSFLRDSYRRVLQVKRDTVSCWVRKVRSQGSLEMKEMQRKTCCCISWLADVLQTEDLRLLNSQFFFRWHVLQKSKKSQSLLDVSLWPQEWGKTNDVMHPMIHFNRSLPSTTRCIFEWVHNFLAFDHSFDDSSVTLLLLPLIRQIRLNVSFKYKGLLECNYSLPSNKRSERHEKSLLRGDN